jgi:TonB-linked SusC/RagA family outer membrane protein
MKIDVKAGSALGNPTYDTSGGEKKIYMETSLNYKRTFAKKHDVTGLLLYMQKERQRQRPIDDNRQNTLLPYRKQSVVARATYGYDTRYMLEASFGATGSENFAAGHRWGIFPAIGAAWYVSHEAFMQPVEDYINQLKLRASFGITGNDEIGSDERLRERWPYQESLTDGPGYPMGLTPGTNGNVSEGSGNAVIEDNFATPNLTWEREQKINVGVDLGLFRGRVDLTVDWFNNRRDNILIRRNTTPTAAGFRKDLWQNFGVTTNKGMDASLVLKQRVGEVNLSARGNLTYAKNKITELDEVPQVYSYQTQTGTPIDQPYLYIAEGLYTPDDFDISQAANGSYIYTLKEGLPNPGKAVAPGDIKYRDLNEDGEIGAMDQTYQNGMYPEDPQLVYGFGFNADWKGIFFGIFFQGTGNSSVNLLNAGTFMPFNQGIDASSARTEALDRWTYDNPYNQNVLYPRTHSTIFDNNTRASTWWYRSGDFLRLKNLELGYQFNKNALKKINAQNLRVYLQGTNLAIWDSIKYWDPELGKANSGSKYPICATWTVGLEITF